MVSLVFALVSEVFAADAEEEAAVSLDLAAEAEPAAFVADCSALLALLAAAEAEDAAASLAISFASTHSLSVPSNPYFTAMAYALYAPISFLFAIYRH